MKNDIIRIVIADDHFVVREGLRSIVGKESNIAVVGEAANGLEAIETFMRHNPDVIIMDLRMPIMSGVDAIRKIRGSNPQACILVLSSLDGDETIHIALESGAMGYLLKEDSGEQIIPAIHSIVKGTKWIPSEVQMRLAERNRGECISQREKEVLSLLALGEANKQIAVTLGITEQTVKSHVKNILGKLQVRDRTEAVTVAIRRGVIPFDER